MNRKSSALTVLCALLASNVSVAEEAVLITTKSLNVDLALRVAQAALVECRKAGFQVAISVVDRSGNEQVMLRDQMAGPHTPETAWRKAWSSASFKSNTTKLGDLTQAGKVQSGVRHISNAIMAGGGMPIYAEGVLVGAIGVSGAPGGAEDDKCAQKGLDLLDEELMM